MIDAHFDYVVPESLEEATAYLIGQSDSCILAGGQRLLTDLKLGGLTPKLLVDLRKIASLTTIDSLGDGGVRVGAMVTLNRAATSGPIRAGHPALIDALLSVGDPEVRNRATIGGSLALVDPGADLPAVMLALEAVVNTFGPAGSGAVPASEFFRTGQPALAPGELIASVDLPAGAGSAYEKMRNPASGYAICGAAAVVSRAADGTIQRCRLALSGATDQAVRLRSVEAAVEGSTPTPDTIREAVTRIAGEALTFRDDLAAPADYRAHLAEVLARRALASASQRAERIQP
jgi:carbon-monoxide dehydrogenase medium subunit